MIPPSPGAGINSQATRAYEIKKDMMVQNLKLKDYWPEGMTKPQQYKKFYVANDLSFCGFAKDEKEISRKRKEMISRGSTPAQAVDEN